MNGKKISNGDQVQYRHPVSKKIVTDTVLSVDEDRITVDRNHWHNHQYLIISPSEIVSIESK